VIQNIFMIEHEAIKGLLKRGDYEMVAEAAGISKILVRKVVNGEREDHHRIIDRMKILFAEREQLRKKLKSL
jgi:hypothetical protein